MPVELPRDVGSPGSSTPAVADGDNPAAGWYRAADVLTREGTQPNLFCPKNARNDPKLHDPSFLAVRDYVKTLGRVSNNRYFSNSDASRYLHIFGFHQSKYIILTTPLLPHTHYFFRSDTLLQPTMHSATPPQ